MTNTTFRAHGTLLAGALLIASGILAPLIMIVHPTAEVGDVAARLTSLTETSSLSRHIHLAMIVALWLSLAHLARRWPGSSLVWAATQLYALSAAAML